MNMTAETAWNLLEEVAAEYRKVLRDNMVGVYAHGSLTMGCFRWDVSDIDFLVAAESSLEQDEKEALIRILLDRIAEAPPKGFEMSVVLRKDVSLFRYPTPYELHFSNAYLEEYRNDLSGTCRRLNGTDPDLAAHCTVIRSRGQTVCGQPIGNVFGEVPFAAYCDSIWLDVREAGENLRGNPVYFILNLCRSLAAVRTQSVLSKEEGGLWALQNLCIDYCNAVKTALEAYRGNGAAELRFEEAEAFARYATEEIDAKRPKSLL